MKYALLLHYNGGNYHGWQVQKTAVSVQGTLEDRLSQLHGNCPVRVHGCGRTDTGVHAKYFVAHIEVENELNCRVLRFKLNNMLPADVAVYKVVPVYGDFHARFSALSRSYTYYITREKNAYLAAFTAFYKDEFQVDQMNAACRVLLQHKDFASFCKAGAQNKTTLCAVEHAHWRTCDNLLVFEITADRFLRNMVRAVVGTMLEVGTGRLSITEFNNVILAKDRRKAGYSVPGRGLHLSHVEYPAAYLPAFKPIPNTVPHA